MASDYQTGSFLRTLASSKPKSNILELGTGTGLSTCWLLDGMCKDSKLTSVDNDSKYADIAETCLGKDPRVSFFITDGAAFLSTIRGNKYDLIFADTWPGKYDGLYTALGLLKKGGIYLIDDMLPQKNWPDDHALKVEKLISTLENDRNYLMAKLSWSTGIIIVTRKHQ